MSISKQPPLTVLHDYYFTKTDFAYFIDTFNSSFVT